MLASDINIFILLFNNQYAKLLKELDFDTNWGTAVGNISWSFHNKKLQHVQKLHMDVSDVFHQLINRHQEHPRSSQQCVHFHKMMICLYEIQHGSEKYIPLMFKLTK